MDAITLEFEIDSVSALRDLCLRLHDELEAVRRNEARWRAAFEGANQGVWEHVLTTDHYFYTDTWCRIRGLDPEKPLDTSLEAWLTGVHPDDRERVLTAIQARNGGGKGFDILEYRERHADGHWIWIETRCSASEWDETGKPTRIIGTDSDITARKAAEQDVADANRRLRLALDISKIGVFEANLDTGVVHRDDGLLEIYGLFGANLDIDGTLLQSCLHPDDREASLARIAAGITSGKPFENAFRIVRADGEIRHIRSTSLTYLDFNGARKLVGANWDVTDDIRLQEQLQLAGSLAEQRNVNLEAARARIEHLARHDELTGLLNRRGIEEQFDRWQAGTRAYGAIIHVDLDRFKQINDSFGHHVGDCMLKHVALTLRDISGGRDVVARIGGDEFVILCDRSHSAAEIQAIASRITEALRQPVQFESHFCRFGASVGLAWADHRKTPNQLLIEADIALYHAKSLGRNRVAIFSDKLRDEAMRKKIVADEIIIALERGQFIPFYQPQYDTRTLTLIGVETLARWRHPERGLLGPADFLDVAADIDIISSIDRMIAGQAASDLKDWQARGVAVPRVAVNISARRLKDPGLIETMRNIGLSPGCFAIELLESIFLDDMDDTVAKTVEELKALGIEIEIDDFGTGHASILGLLKLGPHRLKIDRSLVMPIVHGSQHQKLVASIIEIGHSLGIEVVAEGVETQAHIDLLQQLGCDVLQGYVLARPMDKAGIEALCASAAARPA